MTSEIKASFRASMKCFDTNCLAIEDLTQLKYKRFSAPPCLWDFENSVEIVLHKHAILSAKFSGYAHLFEQIDFFRGRCPKIHAIVIPQLQRGSIPAHKSHSGP